MRDRREKERRRPGVVKQRHDPARPGGRDDRGHVLHLERQAARTFHEDRARALADHVRDAAADQRVVEACRDPEPLEQAVREPPRRFVGAVDQQQLVARRQHREQRGGDRRDAGGIEEGRLRPRLQARQGVREAPLRRRAAPAVIEAVMRVPMAVGAQVRDRIVEDGGCAPDRRVDDPAGPFGAPPGLDDAGRIVQRAVGIMLVQGPVRLPSPLVWIGPRPIPTSYRHRAPRRGRAGAARTRAWRR